LLKLISNITIIYSFIIKKFHKTILKNFSTLMYLSEH